jgi:ribosome-associated protein
VQASCEALLSRRAADVVVLRVAELTSVTDHFVIASGTSRTQVQALADAVRARLLAAGCPALRCEGYAEARWICLDYGDLVVHVFLEEVRRVFDLERLWGDAPRRRVEAQAAATSA